MEGRCLIRECIDVCMCGADVQMATIVLLDYQII